MINFVSLNTICTDLLYLARGSKVVSTETLTMKQIEYWVHQYRAILIKQDLDKGRIPDEGFIQELTALKLMPVDRAGELSKITTGKRTYKTVLQLPKVLNLANKDGIFYIGTLEGDEIQLIAESRANWQSYKKYTAEEPIAYMKNQYMYVVTPLPLEYISIRAVFEIPTEAMYFINPTSNITEYDINAPYPIPVHLLPTLKELILKKELNVILSTPSDSTNDSQNKVESNVEKG